MQTKIITMQEVEVIIRSFVAKLGSIDRMHNRVINVYGVPRGGMVPAQMLVNALNCMDWANAVASYDALEADVIVDDLVDSGATRLRHESANPRAVFLALFEKDSTSKWLVFPWEKEDVSAGIEDNIIRILQFVGEDPNRGGLLETPKRVAKAWGDWTSGYGADTKVILKCFEDGADGCDEMVVVRNIPFYSHCEHHMAPFFGTATVAYIPDKKIVGLSKLARLVDVYAKRLQVQERMTNQIADDVLQHLNPKGVGVLIRARHLCIESRGIAKQGSVTTTTALRGVMRTENSARSEFLLAANDNTSV